MEQFSFEYPLVFLLLLLFAVCQIWCKEKNRAIYFPHLSSLMLKKRKSIPWLLALKWLGIVSAIIALASPIMTEVASNDYKNGKDIILVLDSSESMLEPTGNTLLGDTKFEVAKNAIDRFMEQRNSDRLGLVTFGDAAFVASPLTFDTQFLREILQMQQVGIAGARTAINDAVAQSYGTLERSKSKSKVVILLTDGMENQSIVDESELLSLMSKSQIKLYTIGLGYGFDSAYLRKLASSGHGEAFEAKDDKTLTNIYDRINALENSKLESKPKTYTNYLFVYPLFLAWLSLILYIYFRNQRGA
jgi:Ca-activated chloride channel family protein